VAIGTAAALFPRSSLRFLGFDAESASAQVLARMAGARDLALAGLIGANLDDSERLREATWSGVTVDAGDAAAFLIAGLRQPELRRAAALSAPLALAATAAGCWLAGRLDQG
jgi:hypothetical protein